MLLSHPLKARASCLLGGRSYETHHASVKWLINLMTVFNINFSPFPFRSEHFPFNTSKCLIKSLKTVSSFQRQAKVKKKKIARKSVHSDER